MKGLRALPDRARTGRLHVEMQGRGPDMVLLHGWGLHSGVWDEVVPSLAKTYRVWRVDLPGHGRSASCPGDYTLEGVADAVRTALPVEVRTASWVGWSLGGLVALQLALAAPLQVTALVMVAASPRFVRAPDWPMAMAPAVLDGFARSLDEDYPATLQRFLALQVRGSEHARADLRRLRTRLLIHGVPDPHALRSGLHILAHTDLRARLGTLQCPLGLMAGERDTLMPAAALEPIRHYCQRPSPDGTVPRVATAVIAGAGHAPFLSHPDAFIDTLKRLLHGG